MTVRVGVVGVGMIGQDHIRRLTRVLSGVDVVAVSDVDAGRARAVAGGLRDAAVHATGEELVADDRVDAVVVCSWGETHEQYVLAAIAAGKPVFCEKPLATTPGGLPADPRRRDRGRPAAGPGRLHAPVRRRPTGRCARSCRTARSALPLLMHCTHRNPSVPAHYRTESMINDTAVHEIDMVRWMFGEEIAATTVLRPRRSRQRRRPAGPAGRCCWRRPAGSSSTSRCSVNIRYGYDIRGEVVGESGTATLAEPRPVQVRRAGPASDRVPADWRERFVRAYDVELQEWVDAVGGDGELGPSSWDGYAATAVSDAGLEALRTGARVPVSLVDRPALYEK